MRPKARRPISLTFVRANVRVDYTAGCLSPGSSLSWRVASQVLILPGLYNAGPGHWQTLWQAAHPTYRRVFQEEWVSPHCDDWVRNLDAAVIDGGQDVVLVAHSSACALVGHWWTRHRREICGALLVAPSDTESISYPSGPSGFAPMPLCRFPFPTILVASINDPAVSFERAKLFAASWGSELINAGAAGHIEAKSGYGPWPNGHVLLDRLIRRVSD
jgi:predicted alpha/beta hydrolase family esterase